MKVKKDDKELQKVLDKIANGINSSEVFKKTMKQIEKSKNKKGVKNGKLSNME
tara:strand:- start:169 stop:327 length:159 start_codon:yes stop_codon:yes gene_type:complete